MEINMINANDLLVCKILDVNNDCFMCLREYNLIVSTFGISGWKYVGFGVRPS